MATECPLAQAEFGYHSARPRAGEAGAQFPGLTFRRLPVGLRRRRRLDHWSRHVDAIDRWLLDVLLEGELPGDVAATGETSRDLLYEHYAEAARRYGERKVLTRNEFGQKLRARLRGEKTAVVDTRPRSNGVRVRCYQLPSLVECRAAFELTTGLSFDWPRNPDDGESDPEWTGSHWGPRGARCACPACSKHELWTA